MKIIVVNRTSYCEVRKCIREYGDKTEYKRGEKQPPAAVLVVRRSWGGLVARMAMLTVARVGVRLVRG